MHLLKNIFLYVLIKVGYLAVPDYVSELTSDHPDRESIQPNQVIVVGSKKYTKWAYLKCPCGCGDFIMLSLSKKKKPSWSVSTDFFNRPSIYPSIKQTSGCRSHFWIKRGMINWCEDSGKCINFQIYC